MMRLDSINIDNNLERSFNRGRGMMEFSRRTADPITTLCFSMRRDREMSPSEKLNLEQAEMMIIDALNNDKEIIVEFDYGNGNVLEA